MERFRERRARVWVVVILLLGLFVGLVGRLGLIQARDAGTYRALADAQHRVRVPLAVPRGTILDRAGRELALSTRSYSVFMNPREVAYREKTAYRLSELLGVDAGTLLARLGGPPQPICVKWGLTDEDRKRLAESHVQSRLGDALRVEEGALWVQPEKLSPLDRQAAATELARVVSRSRRALVAELEGPREFAWVKRGVSEEERRRVAGDRELPGVGLVPEYRRTYPHGELAAQLVGFVGLDQEGLEGVEMALDSTLSGEQGFMTFERDAAGQLIGGLGLPRREPTPGADVELTIDAVIQGYVEEALKELCETWAPRGGAIAVVVDPRTGDILAAACIPSFDPNRFWEYRAVDLRECARARFAMDWMEPGSIMKPFVLCAALVERLITEDTVFYCENGVWIVGSRRFRDHHAYGNLSAAEVIIKSSNVGAAKIGTKLGPDRLYRHLRRFGFGEPTGYPVSGESPGKLMPPSTWTSFTVPSVSVGQEVCVSTLQLSMAYATIANDGVRMRPRLVRRVLRDDGTWQEIPAREVCRVIPATISEQVRRILLRTVEEGTGRPARSLLYTMGGKTGTAQKPEPGGRGYSHTRLTCSFAAMAPIERPRIVVVVSVDEPTRTAAGRHFGGTVAAPAVGRIVNRTLAYLGVPPDRAQTLARLGLSETPERASR